MELSSFDTGCFEELLLVLQGEYPSFSNNYFVLLDRLEKANSAFYQELNKNLKRLDREGRRSYYSWLHSGLSAVEVSYDADLLKMQLKSYSEDSDSFPRYSNPVLISQLEINVSLQKLHWGSPAEQEGTEAALSLQKLFLNHLYNRKISEIQQYLEKAFEEQEPWGYISSRELAEGKEGFGALCWN